MKLKNLLVLPMIAGLMLMGGCKKTTPVEPEPTPVEPETPEEPEEPEVPEEPEEVLTPASVLWSIAQAAWGDLAEESDVEGPDEQGFYSLAYAIGYGENLTQEDATEENLNGVLSTNITALMPEGISLLQGPTFTENGLKVSETESINKSNAYWGTADYSIIVGAYDYVHPSHGQIFVSIYAYSAAE